MNHPVADNVILLFKSFVENPDEEFNRGNEKDQEAIRKVVVELSDQDIKMFDQEYRDYIDFQINKVPFRGLRPYVLEAVARELEKQGKLSNCSERAKIEALLDNYLGEDEIS